MNDRRLVSERDDGKTTGLRPVPGGSAQTVMVSWRKTATGPQPWAMSPVSGVGLLDDRPSSHPVEAQVPKAFAPEFRRKVLDLVVAGRPVAQMAHDLELTAQAIFPQRWRG